ANYNRRLSKGFIVSLIGLVLFLTVMVFIYINFSSFRLESLRGGLINNWLAFLLLGSILLLPGQSVSAAIEDPLSKSGLRIMLALALSLYLFVRLLCLLFISGGLFLDVTLILAVVIILLAAFLAIAQNSLKKILVFAVLSQAGFLILAFCQSNIASFRIALLYLFSQGLGLSGLFLCAALIERAAGSDDINDCSGFFKSMPYTGIGFLLCAFSIIAIPPFLGFWPKLFTTMSAVREGHIAIELFAISGAFLTLFYLMRAFNKIFLGELKVNGVEERKSLILWIAFGLGILSLFLGFAVKLPYNFIEALIR
ncbi:MAG: proton-conducting transporter membrane subunit, partial [Candidatus Omnitrophota bacterium]